MTRLIRSSAVSLLIVCLAGCAMHARPDGRPVPPASTPESAGRHGRVTRPGACRCPAAAGADAHAGASPGCGAGVPATPDPGCRVRSSERRDAVEPAGCGRVRRTGAHLARLGLPAARHGRQRAGRLLRASIGGRAQHARHAARGRRPDGGRAPRLRGCTGPRSRGGVRAGEQVSTRGLLNRLLMSRVPWGRLAALTFGVLALTTVTAATTAFRDEDTDLSVRITSPLGRTGGIGAVRIVAQIQQASGATPQPRPLLRRRHAVQDRRRRSAVCGGVDRRESIRAPRTGGRGRRQRGPQGTGHGRPRSVRNHRDLRSGERPARSRRLRQEGPLRERPELGQLRRQGRRRRASHRPRQPRARAGHVRPAHRQQPEHVAPLRLRERRGHAAHGLPAAEGHCGRGALRQAPGGIDRARRAIVAPSSRRSSISSRPAARRFSTPSSSSASDCPRPRTDARSSSSATATTSTVTPRSRMRWPQSRARD